MIIDTHCHLDNEQYYEDIDEVIQRALEHNIKGFLIPGADFKDLPQAIKLAEKYEQIFFSVGIHPYDIDKYDEKIMQEFVTHPKCIAIGECGLDYYRLPEDEKEKEENIKKQKEVFIAQIEFAKKVKKPLIVHIREASNDSKQILEKYGAKEVGGVLHCYNASEHLLSLAEDNFYFGIGGVLTFKNARKLVEILPKIPLEKLIIETDGPYLTPHPHRGKRNEPYYTIFVAQKMAELLNLSQEEIENLTTNNAKTLFKQFSNII
ncbi:TatD family hydrolase [Halarcobacter ebronensis]|uniref:Hydrolase TatD n=1 Tax=Halarcobacter ebronensis TaxID=1462615 RepID=A0A4Q1ANG7_9BACT|nr:TatD family hydrolase [Halarcobacter ebronensis]QKF82284.1 ssDNA/RNA exonuclease, 3' - 5' specific [Halarcobacter ebronensis]RXK07683.1 hydrolase TatD [Halarcobacter ebronensis]